ncbi:MULTISPECIES: SDR family NAD(P)-dependent oxidoreductase [unclassified Streptomyces]|uniref:SDR family NAD(P)-dependent oxidoreductase n=1 Tax=unclassified Streptomyces TaxID=2593676 RepID=UPI001BE8BA13|nr:MULTISPECIES: SDR family NAD(P)-dependent oxidoreductase [unclassified Streptomyces]MBT2402578.1 SDR family NAD(P)-dependent oxidoreductase [Streptomyces sp. ISL-21]MBT2607971.1 SDR family NAD(P)-dependent oxidoreductase [Streptomyces sp. ISL-87]
MTGNKTVLITGTSSGIGLAAAVATAKAGWHTVATMRDTGRADALLKAATEAGVADLVQVKRLDVTDAESVTSCLEEVVAEHGRLDAVVNNAGAGFVGTIEQNGMEPVRAAMEVNYFGVVELTRAALPHLRASGGRVITVTSVGGVIGQPFNEAYCAAKFAVEGFMESLAPVAASVGVQVSVVEPGAVASEFIASQGIDIPGLLTAAGPYAAALEAYIDRTLKSFGNAQTSAEAAAPVVALLAAERMPFRVQTSDWARDFVGVKLADADGSAVQTLTGGWLH